MANLNITRIISVTETVEVNEGNYPGMNAEAARQYELALPDAAVVEKFCSSIAQLVTTGQLQITQGIEVVP